MTSQRRCSCCLVSILLGAIWSLRCGAGPSPPQVIVVDSSSDSDSSEMPWAPLEPEPHSVPGIEEADEVMDMPVQHGGPIPNLDEPAHPQDKPRRRERAGEGSSASSSSPTSASFPALFRQHPPAQPAGGTHPVQGGYPVHGGIPITTQGQPLYTAPATVMTTGEPAALPTGDQSHTMYRIGYAPTYDPAADPWHEDGNFEGVSAEMGALLSGRQPQQTYGGQHSGHNLPYDPWEDDLEPPAHGVPATAQLPQARVPPQQQGARPLPQHGLPHQGPHHHQPTTGAQIPGAGQFDPPTMDPWGVIARQYASHGPLLPPHQWQHNALGLGTSHHARRPMSPSPSEATTCANDPDEQACEGTAGEEDEEPKISHTHDIEQTAPEENEVMTDTHNDIDDLEWESDLPDSEDEEVDPEPERTPTDQGGKPPKRPAGHGSQRVTNKAKKSDVKKRWRELDWGKKPKWLSWRKARDYVIRGEKPPLKEPLPPTPSPQREHLRSLLLAHHYSYDARGNLVPFHFPQQQPQQDPQQGEKAANQAKLDHAQRRDANPYLKPAPQRPQQPATSTSASASVSTVPTPSKPGRRAMDPKRRESRDVAADQRGEPPDQTNHHSTASYNDLDTPQQPPLQQSSLPQPHKEKPRKKVDFELPAGHREDPPRPARRQNVWRKLTDSTTVQLRGDGVYHYPIQYVDNRPAHRQGEPFPTTLKPDISPDDYHNNDRHNLQGDELVVQPRHLTGANDEMASSSSSSSSQRTATRPNSETGPERTGGPTLPATDDLDQQAAEAIQQGRAPPWRAAQEPRPPTPPQRPDPTTTPKSRPTSTGGFNPQRFVDTRPLRGRLISPEQEDARATTSSTGSSRPSGPARQRPNEPKAKAKPPQPPQTSGSESETSWPSEDPPPGEGDPNSLLQLEQAEWIDDPVSFMQRQQQPPTTRTDPPTGSSQPSCPRPTLPTTATAPTAQSPEAEAPWYSVEANFGEEFTVAGLLRVLQKILHEILQQSFSQPNEYLTTLAYHACYYVSKLQSQNDRRPQQGPQGADPNNVMSPGPTSMVFCLTNSFIEAETTLASLVQHYRDLPRRHLQKELQRAEDLLRDGRAVCKSWARDPNAPGALPGTAASQNALDGVSFSLLALEEGGLASLEESLQIALAATQRCNNYMDELLAWIEMQFQASHKEGSPSPKKRKTEQATGSGCPPQYTTTQPELADGRDAKPPLRRRQGDPHPEIPVPPRRPLQAEPAQSPRAAVVPEPGAAPYNILKAQHILETVMPFTEQEVASALCDVHSLLAQWTTSLWGEPIVLTDSLENNDQNGNPQQLAGHGHTADLPPTMATGSSDDETASVSSHRRRRAHAAFDT